MVVNDTDVCEGAKVKVKYKKKFLECTVPKKGIVMQFYILVSLPKGPGASTLTVIVSSPLNYRGIQFGRCRTLTSKVLTFFFQGQPTNSMGLKTARSCMDTPMNMYSSKGHIKRLSRAFFLADIQAMTSQN